MVDKKRFLPNDDGLDFSAQLAEALGMDFDRAQTRALSIDLLDRQFADICKALPQETEGCRLENMAFRDFSAFGQVSLDKAVITIDQQWALFLTSVTMLVCIRSFYVLDEAEDRDTQRLFKHALLSFRNPHQHEMLREPMRNYFRRFARAMPIMHLLCNAMYGFMICHEIAHVRLGHFKLEPSPEMELEADRTGLAYLFKVSEQFETLPHMSIPPNFLGAPILAMRYLQALEKIGAASTKGTLHPAAEIRAQNLEEALNKEGNDEARHLLAWLEKGLSDLTDTAIP